MSPLQAETTLPSVCRVIARNGNPILVVRRSPAVKIDGGARATGTTMMVSSPVVSPKNLQLIRRREFDEDNLAAAELLRVYFSI